MLCHDPGHNNENEHDNTKASDSSEEQTLSHVLICCEHILIVPKHRKHLNDKHIAGLGFKCEIILTL